MRAETCRHSWAPLRNVLASCVVDKSDQSCSSLEPSHAAPNPQESSDSHPAEFSIGLCFGQSRNKNVGETPAATTPKSENCGSLLSGRAELEVKEELGREPELLFPDPAINHIANPH